MKKCSLLATLLLAGAEIEAQAPPAPAQASGSDRVVYDAAFYAQFAPRTALDMVNQTPGFVLDAPEDEEARRGFSGAVGNVLVDGERLSAKSQSLQDVLGRVRASEVLRIEVLRGSAVAGDASGATVLANVVRTRTSGGGTWEAGVEVTNEDEPAPNGKFGWSGRSEATEYSVGGSMFTHDHFSGGPQRILDGAGNEIAQRYDAFPHQHGEYTLNGQLSRPAGAGKLTVTGQFEYFSLREQGSQLTTAGGAQLEDEHNPYREKSRTGEAGVTWQRALGAWDMNFTTLLTRKQLDWDVTSTHFDAGGVEDAQYQQDVDQASGESIVRGTFLRALANGRLEVGGEVAVNTLDGTTTLTADLGAGPVPVLLPNADLEVEETRGEAFVSHVWNIGESWSLDSRLAGEYSRLSFTGDTDQSVTLGYVKPRIQLTRKLGQHQVQARVYRDVGQLDFADFVSTAELANDLINAGNPDLKPQTAWAVEADADLRFAGDAALRVRAYRHFLDDVVDFVPVGPPGDQFDAPGNIGEGSIVGVELTVRVPLAAVLPGGTLSFSGTFEDSEVTDPVTGEERQISDYNENRVTVDLRQDLNDLRLAWGAHFETASPETLFRVSETNEFRGLRMLNLFVETTWIENFKLRLEAQNALGDTEARDRRLYSPDRNGALIQREVGTFHPGRWWLLQISSSF